MSSPSLSAAEIYRRIPHSGAMRLLAGVTFWNDSSIVCSATSHMEIDNPLRDNGVLSNVHALEYAAQAIAVHGSLLMDEASEPKLERDGSRSDRLQSEIQISGDSTRNHLDLVYVATFRGVDMHPGALDQRRGAALTISATRVAALPNGWNYEFTVMAQDLVLARGKTVVVARGVAT